MLGICCFCCLQISFGFLVSVYYALCILILFLFLNTFAGPNDVYQIEIWNLSHFRNVVRHEAISAWTHMVYGIIYPLIHFYICSLSNRNELKWSIVVLAMFCSDNLVNVFCCLSCFGQRFSAAQSFFGAWPINPNPGAKAYTYIYMARFPTICRICTSLFADRALANTWQVRSKTNKKREVKNRKENNLE